MRYKKTPQTRVLYKHCRKVVGMLVFGVFLIVAIVSSLHPKQAEALTPSNLNFQARLQTISGGIVPDGFYNVEFKLYSAVSGGSALWTEDWYDSNGVTAGNDNRVRVKNGYLTVNLGAQNPFGALNWDQEMWITMNIGGVTQTATPTYDGEMNPRLKLTAVAYAFKAGDSATLGGIAASGFIQNTTTPQSANIAVQSATNTDISLLIKQKSGQTSDLLRIQDSSAATLLSIDQFGNAYLPGQLSGGAITSDVYFGGTSNLTLRQNDTAPTVPLSIFRGGASPTATADLIQLQNSSSQKLAGFDNAGQLYLGRAGGSGSTGSLNLFNATNTNTVTVQSGTTSSSYTLTLPTALGSTNDCLKDTGSGVLGFGACATTGGATSVGAIGSPTTNGGSISAGVLTLAAADGSNGGVLTSGAQTIGGAKTFNGNIIGGSDLNISGNTTIGGNLVVHGNANVFKPTVDSSGAFQIQPSGSTTPIFNVDTGNKRVGIGTATPNDVFSLVTADNTVGLNHQNAVGSIQLITYIGNSTGTCSTNISSCAQFGTATNTALQLGTNAIPRITITAGGSVGIGTDNPGYALHVAGEINATTGFRANGNAGLASLTCSGGQLLQNAVVVGGIVTGGSCVSPVASGVTTVGTFSATSITNGASIAGSTITLGVADATNPGMLSTVAQTIGGAKTFNSTISTTQLTSTVTTGTAPLVVASTTKVTNLNADLLDGLDSTGFIQNTATLQTNANIAISSAANGSISLYIQQKSGQTADLLQIKSSGAVTMLSLDQFGSLYNSGQFYNAAEAGFGIAASSGFQTRITGAAGNIGLSVQGNGTQSVAQFLGDSTKALTYNAAGTLALVTGASQTTDGQSITLSSTSAITNGILVNRTGASGTTTNGVNITNTAGTMTNGLAFTGTIGTDINRGTGALTINGASGINLKNGGTTIAAIASGGVTVTGVTDSSGGYKTNGGTLGASTTCSGGQFLQNQVVSGGITTGGTCATAGAVTDLQSAYTGGSSITLNTVGVTIKNNATPIAGNLFQIQNNGGTANFFAVSAAGATIQDSSANDAFVFDSSGDSHLRLYANTTTPTLYADIYYDTSNSEAVFAASSGTTRIGNGNGNITLQLSNTADVLQGTKTLASLAGAYSSNDFNFVRNITAGANALTGAVVKIESTSTGSSTLASNILLLNENNLSATGNLILGQKNGSDKFKVDTGGTVTIATGQSYTGAGAVSLISGAATALTVTGNAASTFSTTSGDLTLLAGGASKVVVKPGTNSSTSFQVQNSGGTPYFTADTSGVLLQVGSSTTDATAVLLVLDSYNTTDPTGVNGAMYYSTSTNRFRCYENSAWKDCSTGYSIGVQALTSSPTDARTVYFGMLPKAPTTVAATSKVYIRKTGTIKIAEIYCFSGTAGTNEAWSLYIRKNDTTDTLIATVSAATSERVFTNSSLSISVTAGDYIEIKGIQPTWVTNPLTTIYGGYISIE